MARHTTAAVGLGAALLTVLGLAGCGESAPERVREEMWTYPVSHIFLAHKDGGFGETVRQLDQIQAELASGRSFASVARDRSEDKASAAAGGFLGFLKPREDNSFTGAFQALTPGLVQGPVGTEQGLHLFLRHTFEEGRAIEQEGAIPAYGFFVGHREGAAPADRSRGEAQRIAEDVKRKILAGEMTLPEAREQFGPRDQRQENRLAALVSKYGDAKPLYDQLAQLEIGEWLPIEEHPAGFPVMWRGRYLRAIARHILIQHVTSTNRSLGVRRSRDEAAALAEKALSEVASDGSNWSTMVRRYGDETSIVPLEGSLGCVTNGDLLPDLEEVLLALEPGQVASHVVETPLGFHILYRVK